MIKPFYLLYFIHDDLESEFELNTLLNILAAPKTKYTNILLLHNKRFVRIDKKGVESAYYETIIRKVCNNGNGLNSFKLVHKALLWQDAFKYVFSNIIPRKNRRIGLITLSHAAGIVINRNGKDLPLLTSPGSIRDFIRRSRPVSRFLNKSYFFATEADNKVYVSTKTVIGSVKPNGNIQPPVNVFEAKYVRTEAQFFCKYYEGLFIYQLSSFFAKERIKFEFIILSNCCVQLFDNAYLLAPVTKYMMATESDNDRVFWNLPVIAKTIEQHRGESSRTLVKEIFDNCAAAFIVPDNTLHYFLSGLEDFEKLDIVFEQLIDAILEQLGSDKQFKLALQNWLPTAPIIIRDPRFAFIDTIVFFEKSNELSQVKFLDKINAYKQVLSDVIVSRRSTGEGFCGFALYVPRTLAEFQKLNGAACNYFNSFDKNPFVLHSHYDEFLIALYS